MRIKLQPLVNDQQQIQALEEMRAVCRSEGGQDPYETGPGEYWFVLDEEGKIIGFTGLHSMDVISRRVRGAGLWITPERRRRGYGKEALVARAYLAFEDRNINRMEFLVSNDNQACIDMCNSAGFIEEAFIRELSYYGGKMHDYRQFRMLRSEWDALKKSETASLEAV